MLCFFVVLLAFSLGHSFYPKTLASPRKQTIVQVPMPYPLVLHAVTSSEVVLPEKISKQRLDVFLSTAFPDRSRSFMSDLCDKGAVRVNDKVVTKSHKVSSGDVVELEIEEKEESSVEPENIKLDILYEDDDIIAVNKPNGMVVHPAPGSPNNTFVNALLFHLGPSAQRLFEQGSDEEISSSISDDKYSLAALSALPRKELQSLAKNCNIKANAGSAILIEQLVRFGKQAKKDKAAAGQSATAVVAARTGSGKEEQEETVEEEVEDEDALYYESILNTKVPIDLPETPEAANASPSSLRPGVVHRLDKGTTGVLLAGKHPQAVAKLMALFAKRKVRKVYLAVCIGHPGDATMIEPIGRSQKNRQLMTVYDGPPGKSAVTHVRTLAFDGKLSAALVRIETGRTHQIRVHLKERRTPIAGDEAYGNSEWNKKLARSDQIQRPLLHAYETEITHPFTGKQIIFRAPLPDDMSKLMQKLTSASSPVLDPETNLLIGSTVVKGKGPGEKGGGFVPEDRLRYEEEHFTSWELPETQEDEFHPKPW